ncbi:MAG: alkaline phosphatase family protein [Myxococcota bacterium]
MLHRSLALAAALAVTGCHKPIPEVTPPIPPASPAAAPEAAAPARLGVLIVVDQLPVRLLDAPKALYIDGLARLTGEQAFVAVARHPHATTFTGPGHSTISTGTAPARSGIVSNDWYVPGEPEGTDVYCCADASKVMTGTLADQVVAAGGQVASVSLKDRGATLMGGARAQLESWYDREALHFTPPLDDVDVDKWMHEPWTAVHPEAYPALVGADDDPNEGDPGYGTTFPHPAPDTAPKGFLATPFAGDALTDAAIAAIDRMALGTHETPDLLTVSYSETDYIGHTFTAESWEAVDGMVRLDKSIGRLLQHLDEVVGADNYFVALSSDHGSIVAEGAIRIPPDAVAKAGNQALKAAGLMGEVHFEDPGVWLPVPVRADEAARAKGARAVAAAIREIPGIGGAWAWQQDGVDGPYADAVRNSLYDDRSGDVYLLLAEHALFDYPGSEGKGTSHGTPYDNDARVPFLMLGAGVAPGKGAQDYDTRQIAPTVAAMLGVAAPKDSTLEPVGDARR